MFTWVRQLGIRSKLMLLAFLILIPMCTLQAVSILRRFSEEIAAAKDHTLETAELVAADFTRYLTGIWSLQAAVGAALVSETAPREREAMEQTLRAYQSADPSLECLMWFGPDGRLRATSVKDSPDVSAWDRDYFQAILQGRDRVIADLLISRVSGKPAIAVATAIRRGESLAGVVISCVDLTVLNQAFVPSHHSAGSYMLIDTTGIIVFHSGRTELTPDQRLLPANSPARYVLTSGQPLQFASVFADPDHVRRLGGAVPIPDIGWVALASHPSADVLLKARQDASLQIMILIVIAILSLSGVLYVGRRILQPILAVQQAARRLAEGDLTARTGAFADQDELGALAGSFDQMAERLQEFETERTHLLMREHEARDAAEAGQQRVSFLAEASRILASSMEYETTLTNVAHLAVPQLADWCVVMLRTEDDALAQVAIAHQEPEKTAFASDFMLRCPPNPEVTSSLWRVLQSGQSHLETDYDRETGTLDRMDDEYTQVLLLLGIKSVMVVPMLARGRATGVLCFLHAESGRRYGQDDLPLAEELAARAALAVENARLYQESQIATRQAAEAFAQLDSLLASAPAGIALLDSDLRFQRVNSAMAAMHQVRLSDYPGRTVREVIPHRADKVEPLIRRVLETGKPEVAWDDTLPAGADSGERRYWQKSVYPVHAADGTVLGAGCIVTDITQRTQMEEALRASELLLTGQKQVLELIATGASLDHILSVIVSIMEQQDPDCTCVVALVNPSGKLKVSEPLPLRQGYCPSVLGAVCWPLQSMGQSAIRQKRPILIADFAAEPRGFTAEVGISSGTCSDAFKSGWCTPILGADGEALGVLATCCQHRRFPGSLQEQLAETLAHLAGIAIERHNAEEARNRKLQLLIDHMAEGVVAIDEEERVLVVNAAASRLLDLGPPDQATPLDQATPPDQATPLDQATPPDQATPLATAGFPLRLVEALRAASLPQSLTPAWCSIGLPGRELDVHVSPVVTDMGRRYGAIALLQDMTVSAQLRKLQESFVANVSHELRAPLTSLSAMAEAINDGLVRGATRTRYLKAILSETERLRRLTNNILEISRLDAGVLTVSREEFEIGLVLESIEETWVLRCSSAQITLEVGRSSSRVIADYDRVLQVMTNLVDNAVKFTPPGGQVRVYAEEAGTHLKIAVADTGPGIPKEHLPNIWTRFYMADAARTRTNSNGMGLGLATARQLVELMGGTVAVVSAPGKGTVFSFSLPLA